jgi:hypothetical protein
VCYNGILYIPKSKGKMVTLNTLDPCDPLSNFLAVFCPCAVVFGSQFSSEDPIQPSAMLIKN